MKRPETNQTENLAYSERVFCTSQEILKITRELNCAIKKEDYEEVDNCLTKRHDLLKLLFNIQKEDMQPNFSIATKNVFQDISKLDLENSDYLKSKKDEIASSLVGLFNSHEVKNYIR